MDIVVTVPKSESKALKEEDGWMAANEGNTFVTWLGLNLILRVPEVLLKAPILMRGFQGFRYINRID